jgi:hypothetical protein
MNPKERIIEITENMALTQELIGICDRLAIKGVGDEKIWIEAIRVEKLVLEDLRKEMKEIYGLSH